MDSAEYPEWIDYEWFALDSVGHIAVFTTAGEGPVPASALAAQTSFGAFDEFVRALPARSAAEMLVTLPRPDDYLMFASRGLFAYDWADVHRVAVSRGGVYELYSRPRQPVLIHELPTEAQRLLQSTSFSTLRFSDCLQVDVRAFFPCAESAA